MICINGKGGMDLIWFGIILVLALLLAGVFYLWTRIRKISFIRNLKEEKSWKYRICIGGYLTLFLIASFIWRINWLVCFLHLVVFWLLADLLNWMAKKLFRKKWEYSYLGAIVLLITIAYLSVGWYNAHHVIETHYTVKSNKEMDGEKFRILQITDMHIGATFDGQEFAEYVKEAAKCNPDLVVATGDFVDEETTKQDMRSSCKALGEISSTYGIYFVYGNHDKGNYTSSRDFSKKELEKELKQNGIKILEDEIVLIEDWLYIVGRKDKSEERYEGRKKMAELVQGLDASKFMLVLDHQPTDYEQQKSEGVDLVLSGHTHGGHIFPVGPIGEAANINCMTYGLRTEGNTTFEVSAGISGWEIPFKTFTVSEYVVIDIEK